MRELVRRVGRVQRLVVFDAAASLGSFTSAARDLGMTQPAVTRQIRALETALGVRLFTRTSNRSELTEAGRSLQRELDAAFSQLDRAVARIGRLRGTFVLACPPGFAHQWLMPRLEQVEAIVGAEDLRLWLFDRDDELAGGGWHLAIRFAEAPPPRSRAQLLFPERVAPLAAPSLARSLGIDATTAPARLLDAPLLHMDDGDRPWVSWTEWFASAGEVLPRQPGRVLFHNYPMVLQSAIAGRGIALGWRGLIEGIVDDGLLVLVGPEIRTTRGYVIETPEGPVASPARELIELLVGHSAASSEH